MSFDIYSDILDDNEKKFGLADFEMSDDRLSTGLLTVDLLIGGGITCGGLFSISGKEASAKSTLLLHTLKSAIDNKIPIIQVRDAEQSMEPKYTSAVVRRTMRSIFGAKDPKTGKWLEKPLARYYNSTALEELFDSLVNTLNQLPDKKFRKDEKKWYFVFAKDDKKSVAFRARLDKEGIKHDSKLFSQTGKYWYPTEDKSPFQAVIFIDSWPSLLPEKIDEEEEQGAAMAEIAREFAKHLKRIVGKFRSKRTIVFGVNQIRDRPGPSFGCFSHNTRVQLADGSSELIGNIVNNKMRVKVLSYNKETGLLEPKRVVSWFNNGRSEKGEYLKITFDRKAENCNQHSYVEVTRGHKMYTEKGIVQAGDLTLETKLMARLPGKVPNADQLQMVYGSILGDGNFYNVKNSTYIKYSHALSQADYAAFKRDMFGATLDTKRYIEINTPYLHLKNITKYLNVNKKNNIQIGQKLVDKLDLRAIAIWYMDDASFNSRGGSNGYKTIIYCQRYSEKSKLRLAQKIEELIPGTSVSITARGLVFYGKENCITLHTAISPFVTEDMKYKVEMANMAVKYKWDNNYASADVEYIKILKIETLDKQVTKYDFEVEDNHNYIVANNNGIVVSNSPEYEPCGNALKFYSNCRNELAARSTPEQFKAWAPDSKGGKIAIEKDVFGKKQRYAYKAFKNSKNKTFTPFMEGWTRIWVRDENGKGRGFDPAFDAYEFLNQLQIVKIEKKNIVFQKLPSSFNCPFSEGETLSWPEFKFVIMNELGEYKGCEIPKNLHNIAKIGLYSWCRKLLDSGKATTLLFTEPEDRKDDKAGKKASKGSKGKADKAKKLSKSKAKKKG